MMTTPPRASASVPTAHDVPCFTVGTRRFLGRHLPADERDYHLRTLLAMESGDVPDDVAMVTIRAFVRSVFPDVALHPPAPSPPWWKFWAPPAAEPLYPIDLFGALPRAEQLALASRWAIVEGLRQLEAEREAQLLAEARGERPPTPPRRPLH